MNGFKSASSFAAVLICSSAALFGQSALAQGQQYEEQAYLERQGRTEQYQRQAQSQNERTIVGTVIKQQDVLLQGNGAEAHRYVTVMDSQGDAILVDLGAPSPDTNLRHGDRIIAVGEVATINGQPVVYATFAGELAAVGRLRAQQQQRQQRQQQQQRQQAPGERVVIGQVVDQRRVKLADMPGAQHHLVKLQNQQGQTIVVNLGAATEEMDIQEGDQLLAVGKSGRINERPVLHARFAGELSQTQIGQQRAQQGQQRGEQQQQFEQQQQAQQERRQLRLRQQRRIQQQREQQGLQAQQGQPSQQQAQQQPQQRQQAQQQAERTVVGEVIDQREVTIADTGATHNLVKLQNQQGQTIVVDLGAATQAMDLQQGDRIIAVGKSARLNNRPVLYAQYAGELQSVGRTDQQQQPGQEQQQGQQQRQQPQQQQGQQGTQQQQ